jgi:hypothetical protein
MSGFGENETSNMSSGRSYLQLVANEFRTRVSYIVLLY